jgi:hypothetical protein
VGGKDVAVHAGTRCLIELNSDPVVQRRLLAQTKMQLDIHQLVMLGKMLSSAIKLLYKRPKYKLR